MEIKVTERNEFPVELAAKGLLELARKIKRTEKEQNIEATKNSYK